MTRSLDSLTEVADDFDAIVLDQWGVLHDGTTPYRGAVSAVERLKASGVKIAVLSNSGKRAEPNRKRIAGMGFASALFDTVMTSGEALWLDLRAQAKSMRIYPITGTEGDAARWAAGLDIQFTDNPRYADAILLMGLAEDADIARYQSTLRAVGERPVYCTNPDRASPRAGGLTIISPGALAHAHVAAGGNVVFYGKPFGAVFQAMARALDVAPARILMVGDSLEHDIAGGHAAGWATAFVEGGLHAGAFTAADRTAALRQLAEQENAPLPDFTLRSLA
ncbi:TIGR01459 family HAD-type hydrolase [Cognatiyoonia sp. IB215182]|uniref:TIGR01459 family HAD-type hydrolase n=1 Tax=Cognatiyoonia sp. IB215182 TaxID=3097353 RepID=UPI002A0CE8ED|nr:TIGR01459 family HAD-type hydrolase [Cognatiyoonia sp. IB215182]MDX8355216.1 TIGR01459 family HAD-type hydrolase [Cognatiyoonia sp. IB215182]